jgi:hypothetical protein
MLMLKPGVRITGLRPEILLAVVAAERAYQEIGHDCMVTACVDGKHMTGSLHYAGQAVDLRTRDVPPADLPKLVARIRDCVGADYDVILENDHLHIEFQPKLPLTNA